MASWKLVLPSMLCLGPTGFSAETCLCYGKLSTPKMRSDILRNTGKFLVSYLTYQTSAPLLIMIIHPHDAARCDDSLVPIV